jgi:hypothetical protein
MNYIIENNKVDENNIVIEKNCKIFNTDSEEEEEEEEEELPQKVSKVKKIVINPLTYSEPIYNEYQCEGFKNKLGKYTFGLDKIIPWEDGGFVFTGGLLFDILTDRFSQDLMDIDLFFYGSIENKIKTINKLCDNLDINQYSYLIGNNKSVIYIFIQGIPRIIQLIMTDKSNPESIINDFDMTHVMSYTDGNKLFCSSKTLEYLETKSKQSIKNKYFHKNRIIKYIERGIVSQNIMLEKYNWVLNEFDSNKYLSTKKQIKFYKLTYNLTRYADGEQIIFSKIDKSKFNLYDLFGCNVNYNKLDNHDFMEGVDMFGAFAQYMGVKKKEEILVDIENLNSSQSEKYYSIGKYELIRGKLCGISNLYYMDREKSLYIPCNFIKNDEIIHDNMNNKILKIYFEIKDHQIINYLKRKINKYLILDALNSNLIDNQLIESKYKLDYNKIYIPFETNDSNNNIIDDEYKTDVKDEKNKTLIVCAKLYNADIAEFYDINDFGILTNLKQSESINCLFDLSIYLSVSKTQQTKKIEYIDINLKPMYIFKNTK